MSVRLVSTTKSSTSATNFAYRQPLSLFELLELTVWAILLFVRMFYSPSRTSTRPLTETLRLGEC